MQKKLKYKIFCTLSSASRIVARGYTDRRMDGHDEAKSHFSKFCERVEKGGKKYLNTKCSDNSPMYSALKLQVHLY